MLVVHLARVRFQRAHARSTPQLEWPHYVNALKVVKSVLVIRARIYSFLKDVWVYRVCMYV